MFANGSCCGSRRSFGLRADRLRPGVDAGVCRAVREREDGVGVVSLPAAHRAKGAHIDDGGYAAVAEATAQPTSVATTAATIVGNMARPFRATPSESVFPARDTETHRAPACSRPRGERSRDGVIVHWDAAVIGRTRATRVQSQRNEHRRPHSTAAEQPAHNRSVVGSSPAGPTIRAVPKAARAQALCPGNDFCGGDSGGSSRCSRSAFWAALRWSGSRTSSACCQ